MFNESDSQALYFAAWQGNVTKLMTTIKQRRSVIPPDFISSLCHPAAQQGHVDAIKALATVGAEVNIILRDGTCVCCCL